MAFEHMRRSYEGRALDREQLSPNPMEQFQRWFDACRETPSPDWFEPNAMTLATADATGEVTARIVLLKKVTATGFAFFTNYQSTKANQLASNPQASLLFYWPNLEQQIRIDGSVTRSDEALSDEYFHQRPRGSQLGAVASEQSRTLGSREELDRRVSELAETYADGQKIPRPDYWGGYVLQPRRFEFWQGRPNRLHDRFVYETEGTGWSLRRVAP